MEKENELVADIECLNLLVPDLYNLYIDLNDKVFVVDVLTTKFLFKELSKGDNFSLLINKDFSPFHENILYGMGSTECSGQSQMLVLDTDKEFKVLNASELPDATWQSTVFNEFNIEITGEPVFNLCKLYKDEETEEYRIKIAYGIEKADYELIRHFLDNTLYLLD